jgi:predicted ester cyclase
MFRLQMTGLALLMLFTFWSETASASDAENNKILVRRFVAANNSLDLSALDAIVAPDMVRHSQSTPHLAITNLADFKDLLKRDAATIDGARVDVDILVAEGDRVAFYGVFSGTHVGTYRSVEATGKSVSLDVSGMFRIQDNVIVEIWILWDNMALLTQLGHPPVGPAASE